MLHPVEERWIELAGCGEPPDLCKRMTGKAYSGCFIKPEGIESELVEAEEEASYCQKKDKLEGATGEERFF